MWLTLLWSNRNLIGAALLALVVGLYIGALKIEIRSLNGKLETAAATLAEANVSLSLEKAKTARLQTALETISKEGERKTATARMWKEKFEDSVKQYQKVVGGLIGWNPMPNEDECKAAKRILREYRK